MARNFYKSWNKAVQAGGLDYDRIRKDKDNISWSQEMVIEKIRLLAENKEKLSSKHNVANQPRGFLRQLNSPCWMLFLQRTFLIT